MFEPQSVYTAISFAPVQGFIEKSRKLRDLFGASLILSYLSQQIAQTAERMPPLVVVSPALIQTQNGTPNRILINGLFERNDVQRALIQAWETILMTCKTWLEANVPASDRYHWEGEWIRWKQCTWEIFWGTGATAEAAMRDLERRKLKRDWTGINWTGESSSLTGTDAIAWTRLGESRDPKHPLTDGEKDELELFYRRLSWLLDDPDRRVGKPMPSKAELVASAQENPDNTGKYIAANERLSIPELVKRLVTYDRIADQIGMERLKQKPGDPEFKDIHREAGYWTGWFMGDGDKVGEHLKTLTTDSENQAFSQAMRNWGQQFKDEFPNRLGRIIYAGGDDFLGVIYSDRKDAPVSAAGAFEWLRGFPAEWQKHQQPINVSVGFVWAGHRVPQRDILQHCREAEKRAKNLGRNRVTLRIVFNSGQFVQWTCPWDYLDILTQYRDRENDQNWSHIYKDWATLKVRHAIRLRETERQDTDSYLARQLFNFYFDHAAQKIERNPPDKRWKYLTGDSSELAIVQWIDDLIQVGWQLCSNT